MASFILGSDISEADWDQLFVVDMHAFQNHPEVLAFSPGGLDSHRERNVIAFKRSVFGGPTERLYAKLTDAGSNQIVSFISARVYRGPTGVIDGDFAREPAPLELPQIEDTEDRKFYEWYWNTRRAALRHSKELQVPHVFIQALGTEPEWQGKGAATMLIKWAFDFVAKENLGRCVLEASAMAMGMRFYEKFGFRVVETSQFVGEGFQGRKSTPVALMVKDV